MFKDILGIVIKYLLIVPRNFQVFDSLVYVVLAVLMFRPPLMGKAMQLKRLLGYSVLLMTFVFAFGTTNAGTAVRHRAKFLPVLVLVAAYPKKVDEETIRVSSLASETLNH